MEKYYDATMYRYRMTVTRLWDMTDDSDAMVRDGILSVLAAIRICDKDLVGNIREVVVVNMCDDAGNKTGFTVDYTASRDGFDVINKAMCDGYETRFGCYDVYNTKVN